MISIDINALSDLEQVEGAIAKLEAIAAPLRMRKRAMGLVFRNTFGEAYKPTDLSFEEFCDELDVTPAWPSPLRQMPFMDPQEAIQDDGIVCLIDGVKRKFLSRYVRSIHDMEWEDYLARYDLPSDYPRTAKDLIEQRSVEAVRRRFGKHDRNSEPEVVKEPQPAEQVKGLTPFRRSFSKRASVPEISVKVEVGGRKLGGML